MRIALGKVRGRVELDSELSEGTSVTAIVLDDDGTFTADAATEKVLLESIAQCDRGADRRDQARSPGPAVLN
jgi:hypothetical protein